MHRSKGAVETMTVMVLISLIGTVALLSVGVGGFKDVLGMTAQSNDAEALKNKLYIPVRNVCIQGTTAKKRVTSFTLSKKAKVVLVSEERDPVKDQRVRAVLVEEGAQLFQTEKISDCVIKFGDGSVQHVFKKGDPYKLEITNQGKQNGKPATEIKVVKR